MTFRSVQSRRSVVSNSVLVDLKCTCSFFKKKCVGGRGGVKTWIETLKTSAKTPRGSGEQNQVNVRPKVSILGGLHFQEDGVDIFPYSSHEVQLQVLDIIY